MAAGKHTSAGRQRKELQVKTARKKVAAAQVTNLKQQVMKEMDKQAHTSENTAPIAPEPMPAKKTEGVIPPSGRPHGWGQDHWLTLMLVVAVVAIIALLMWGQKESGSPAMALHQMEQALAEGNVDALAEQVDEERVASSIIDQFYGDVAFDPAQLPADLRAHLPQGEGVDVQAMAKAGLAERLKQDALGYAAGDVDAENLPHDLFRRIWAGLSDGQPLTYEGVRNVVADNQVAEMDILLSRPDLAEPVTLSLRLEKEADGWKLVDIQDLQGTMIAVAAAKIQPAAGEEEIEIVELEKLPALPPLQDLIQVEGVRKISGTSAGDEKSILVTVKLRNIGPEDVKAFSAEVVFRDAAGQFMKSFSLSDAVGVTRGMRLEKTWRLPVNFRERMEKHIYNLPQQAIQVQVVPRLVEMADGRVVKG